MEDVQLMFSDSLTPTLKIKTTNILMMNPRIHLHNNPVWFLKPLLYFCLMIVLFLPFHFGLNVLS